MTDKKAELSAEEKRLAEYALGELIQLKKYMFNPDFYWSFRAILGCNYEKKRKALSKLFKKIRPLGYVEFACGLMNDDGELAGSGYTITKLGEEFYNKLIKDAKKNIPA